MINESSQLHASLDFIIRVLIPSWSIGIPVETFPSRKSSLRKTRRLYSGVSYVSASRPRLFTKDTPSSISGNTFPFATSLFISLFYFPSKSFLSQIPFSWPASPPCYLGKLKITTLFLSISFATSKTVLPLHYRLFIIARWYPAHETALCCSTLLPARSCYRNPPPDRSARHRRRRPPPADPPTPYVCLDASHRPCRRPTSSSRGIYSGERIAVVICIWKSTRTGALCSVSVPLSISRGSSSPYI